MQNVLLLRLNSRNMGLHLVKGDGNLRTEKTAVISCFGGIFGGMSKNIEMKTLIDKIS